MHTKQEVINAFLELPPKEQEEVKEFVNSTSSGVDFMVKAFHAEYVRGENYSPDIMAEINHDAEEAKKGINVSGPFNTTEELFAHLDSLKSE